MRAATLLVVGVSLVAVINLILAVRHQDASPVKPRILSVDGRQQAEIPDTEMPPLAPAALAPPPRQLPQKVSAVRKEDSGFGKSIDISATEQRETAKKVSPDSSERRQFAKAANEAIKAIRHEEAKREEARPVPLPELELKLDLEKELEEGVEDGMSRDTDMDDIVDPMVRRANAGKVTDVVPVQCNTSKGMLMVEVFPDSWGSLGAARFLELVDAKLFQTQVALHRAVKGFIIQFGTPGDPKWSEQHKGKYPSIRDDPQWLPLGKACGAKRRHGKNKCERHRKGFLSFAGGGPNSRRIEMFVSLADTGHGGDGKQATHEVPFGRILPASFPVLDQLYTGYGEMKSFGGKAPPSGRIGKEGVGFLREEWPLLDFITGCERRQARWGPFPPST